MEVLGVVQLIVCVATLRGRQTYLAEVLVQVVDLFCLLALGRIVVELFNWALLGVEQFVDFILNFLLRRYVLLV